MQILIEERCLLTNFFRSGLFFKIFHFLFVCFARLSVGWERERQWSFDGVLSVEINEGD